MILSIEEGCEIEDVAGSEGPQDGACIIHEKNIHVQKFE
jgi:hypothetical protein